MKGSRFKEKHSKYNFKLLKKRIDLFSIQLLFSCKISPMMYLLIYLLNLCLQIDIQLGSFFQFIWSKDINILSDYKLNFILLLGKQSFFVYIMIIANSLLVLTFLLFLINFCLSIKIAQYQKITFVTKQSILSFFLFLTGKALLPFILAIQMLSVRCFWEPDICSQSASTMTVLISNIVGIGLSIGSQLAQDSLNECIFPEDKILQSSPRNKLVLIRKAIHVFIPFCLAFQDFLESKIQFVIIKGVILLLLSILLWGSVFYIQAYNTLIDNWLFSNVIILWVASAYGLTIDLLNQSSSVLICIACGINIFALLIYGIHLKKTFLFNRTLSTNFENMTVDKTLTQIISFQTFSKSNDIEDNFQIQLFYLKHVSTCVDDLCPCLNRNLNIKNQQNTNEKEQLMQSKFQIDNVDLKKFELLHEKTLQNEDLRNYIILLIFFYNFKQTKLISQQIQLAEIFIDMKINKRLHKAFFNLASIKNQFHLNLDTHSFYYLKTLLLIDLKSFEDSLQIQKINVEDILEIENRFYNYQQQILQTSILVEKFWLHIQNPNFQILSLLDIGINVVDNYMTLRKLYQELITLKPDYQELLTLNISFYKDVMNFEIESTQSSQLLKNMIQKKQLFQQNYYSYIKDNGGIIIISFNPKSNGIIKYCNQIFCELSGYVIGKIINKNYNMLIPQLYQQSHQQVVDNYFQYFNNFSKESKKIKTWPLGSDGYIIPCQTIAQTYISQKLGILVIISIKKNDEFFQQDKNQNKDNDLCVLLANELGMIKYSSKNIFQNKFNSLDFLDLLNNEVVFTIDNLFPEIYKFSKEELKIGIETKIVKNIMDFNNKISLQQDVILQLETVNLGNQKITQLIFKPFKKEVQQIANERSLIQPTDQNYTFQQNQYNMNNDETNEIELKQQLRLENVSLSPSSASTENSIISAKKQVDFNSSPVQILNLSRAIYIYFITLIATSFSVLIVAEIANTKFLTSSNILQQSFLIENGLARFGLEFRMLLQITNQNYMPQPNSTIEIDFKDIQNYIKSDYKLTKDSLAILESNANSMSDALKHYNYDNTVVIYELGTNQTISQQNQSFFTSMTQYFARSQLYVTINYQEFQQNLQTFSLSQLPENPTQYQKDAYFFIINGQRDLWNYAIVVEDQYIFESESQLSQYVELVLIINMCCIFITVVSTMFILPNIFALDTEQEQIMHKWLLVSTETKQIVIQNINKFTFNTNKDMVNARNNQQEDSEQNQQEESKEDNQTESFSNMGYDQLQDNNYKSQKIVNIAESIRKTKLNNIQQNQQVIEDLPQANINFNNQKKQLQNLYSNKKCMKSFILIGCSIFIIVFFASSYLESKFILEEGQYSLQEQRTLNRRKPCVSNMLLYVIEQDDQNQTIYIQGQSAFDLLHVGCSSIEQQVMNIFNFPPRVFKNISQNLLDLNSYKVCQTVFQGNNDIINQCQSSNNGILKHGFYETVSMIFYVCTREYQKFNATLPPNRTKSFLLQQQFNKDIQSLIYLQLNFLKDVGSYMTSQIFIASTNYQSQNTSYYITGFCFFIIFLIIGLIFSIKVILFSLKKVVFRSNILTKLVPINELLKIQKEQLKDTKKK